MKDATKRKKTYVYTKRSVSEHPNTGDTDVDFSASDNQVVLHYFYSVGWQCIVTLLDTVLTSRIY